MIIGAWAQHPTARRIQDPVFDSLRRWTRQDRGGKMQGPLEMPLSDTLRRMDEAGVSVSLVSAWFGPHGGMISNDEVAGFIKEAPDRLVGVGSPITSAYTAKRYPANLVSYMSGHGREKVLFGTNWPMIAPKKALEGLDARELFLAGNAARVFKLSVTA